jgi:16S rRNA processing protein RimM
VSVRQYLELGYVARAHGNRGELSIRPYDPETTAFQEVSSVLLRARDGSERTMKVLSSRPARLWYLIALEGVVSRTQAEELRGSVVLVDREDLTQPAPGEFFQGDLVGLRAIDENGAPVGNVEAIWSTGPVPVLVIREQRGEELLLPFIEPFVGEVDMAQRTVRVRRPEYVTADPETGSEPEPE